MFWLLSVCNLFVSASLRFLVIACAYGFDFLVWGIGFFGC